MSDIEPNPLEPELLDYTKAVGSFMIWSPKGQLFALNEFLVNRDFSKVVPRINPTSFQVLHPLFASVGASSISVVIYPGEQVRVDFLTDLKVGDETKRVKICHGPDQIVANAVAENKFPVIDFGELQKAVIASRQNKSPLIMRVRYLEFRSGLSTSLTDVIKATFLANSTHEGDKTLVLENHLYWLETELRRTMIDGYLSKCVWLDPKSGQLGSMVGNDDRSAFSKFVTGRADITDFSRTLSRDDHGQFEAMRDLASVVPLVVRGLPWNSPTVHVFDESFRAERQLDKYYSLYKGLSVLSAFGAPVLVRTSYELSSTIPVALLQPTPGQAELGAREFPTRHLVWNV